MTRPAARRYSLEPFQHLTGWSMQRITDVAACNAEERRRRIAEGVTERTADRLAVAAGLHPYVVWPEMVDHAIEDAARSDEERRERQRAADRAHKARLRQEPAYRAAQAEYLRQYRASERAKETARRYRRRYYEANRERELARQAEYDRTVRAQRRRQDAA